MIHSDIKIVRYDETNKNQEALKGKWGIIGENWGCVSLLKNMVLVVLYKGASVTDYVLPTVYDGFLMCSDGSIVPVNDSKFSCSLGSDVSGFGVLKLTKDN